MFFLHIHALCHLDSDTTVYVNIIKGIVHFEVHFWYVLAYLKGNQDVGVFESFTQ